MLAVRAPLRYFRPKTAPGLTKKPLRRLHAPSCPWLVIDTLVLSCGRLATSAGAMDFVRRASSRMHIVASIESTADFDDFKKKIAVLSPAEPSSPSTGGCSNDSPAVSLAAEGKHAKQHSWLSRQRIYHTHSFLQNGEPPPQVEEVAAAKASSPMAARRDELLETVERFELFETAADERLAALDTIERARHEAERKSRQAQEEAARERQEEADVLAELKTEVERLRAEKALLTADITIASLEARRISTGTGTLSLADAEQPTAARAPARALAAAQPPFAAATPPSCAASSSDIAVAPVGIVLPSSPSPAGSPIRAAASAVAAAVALRSPRLNNDAPAWLQLAASEVLGEEVEVVVPTEEAAAEAVFAAAAAEAAKAVFTAAADEPAEGAEDAQGAEGTEGEGAKPLTKNQKKKLKGRAKAKDKKAAEPHSAVATVAAGEVDAADEGAVLAPVPVAPVAPVLVPVAEEDVLALEELLAPPSSPTVSASTPATAVAEDDEESYQLESVEAAGAATVAIDQRQDNISTSGEDGPVWDGRGSFGRPYQKSSGSKASEDSSSRGGGGEDSGRGEAEKYDDRRFSFFDGIGSVLDQLLGETMCGGESRAKPRVAEEWQAQRRWTT